LPAAEPLLAEVRVRQGKTPKCPLRARSGTNARSNAMSKVNKSGVGADAVQPRISIHVNEHVRSFSVSSIEPLKSFTPSAESEIDQRHFEGIDIGALGGLIQLRQNLQGGTGVPGHGIYMANICYQRSVAPEKLLGLPHGLQRFGVLALLLINPP